MVKNIVKYKNNNPMKINFSLKWFLSHKLIIYVEPRTDIFLGENCLKVKMVNINRLLLNNKLLFII